MATEDKKFIDLLKGIPERVAELIIKLLSMKGVILALSVYLLKTGNLTVYGFLIIVGMVMFDKAFLKYMDKVKP